MSIILNRILAWCGAKTAFTHRTPLFILPGLVMLASLLGFTPAAYAGHLDVRTKRGVHTMNNRTVISADAAR